MCAARAGVVDLTAASSEEDSDGGDGGDRPVVPPPQKKRKAVGARAAAAAGGGAAPRAIHARRRSTQSCKQKGRRLQKAVATEIRLAFPALQADDVRSCAMGSGGEDVQLSSAARAVFPFAVEIKNRERLNVHAALAQAEANAGAHEPLLVFSKNRSKTWAAVQWPTLLRLLAAEAARGSGGGGT